ncbi:MAG TPA: hypothetical protein VMW69_03095 [Spirochaetia bacterium]|nr:hypothetical protein [Spirochaetia bacterium]
MSESELRAREEEIERELAEYQRERDHLKEILGAYGGKRYSRIDTIMNVVFLVVIVGMFVVQATFKLIEPYVSIEISVLLVSIKIVWMIHSQNKMNHFQFWVLNTIEYRVNEAIRRLQSIERHISRTGNE